MARVAKPKGREPSSKTATTITVRFESREEYEAVVNASRKSGKNISMNGFCRTAILAACNYLSLDQVRLSQDKRFKIKAVNKSVNGEDNLIGSVDTVEQARSVVERFYHAIDGYFLAWADSKIEASEAPK